MDPMDEFVDKESDAASNTASLLMPPPNVSPLHQGASMHSLSRQVSSRTVDVDQIGKFEVRTAIIVDEAQLKSPPGEEKPPESPTTPVSAPWDFRSEMRKSGISQFGSPEEYEKYEKNYLSMPEFALCSPRERLEKNRVHRKNPSTSSSGKRASSLFRESVSGDSMFPPHSQRLKSGSLNHRKESSSNGSENLPKDKFATSSHDNFLSDQYSHEKNNHVNFSSNFRENDDDENENLRELEELTEYMQTRSDFDSVNSAKAHYYHHVFMSNIHLVSLQRLSVKNPNEELRVHKDLQYFASEGSQSSLILDVQENTLVDITELLLSSLVDRGKLQVQDYESAKYALFMKKLDNHLHLNYPQPPSFPSSRFSITDNPLSPPLPLKDFELNEKKVPLESNQISCSPSTSSASSTASCAQKFTLQGAHQIHSNNATLSDIKSSINWNRRVSQAELLSIRDDNLRERERSDANFHLSIQGPGFLIGLGRLPCLQSRVIAFARLAVPITLPSIDGSSTRFVILVLGPTKEEKATKSIVETGNTFASLLSEHQFYADALRAHSPEAMQFFIVNYIKRLEQRDKIIADSKGSFNDSSSPLQLFCGPSSSNDSPIDDFPAKPHQFGVGLKKDIARKLPFYKSDFTDGLDSWSSIGKYSSATIYLFLSCILPAIAFGALWNQNTKSQIGVSEIVLSEAFTGIIFSLLGGQPLMVLRSSGPIAIYGAVLFNWSVTLKVPFLPFYAWVGIWASLVMIFIAFANLSNFILKIGSFTEEAFALLISGIFIETAVEYIVRVYSRDPSERFLMSLVLFFGTYVIAKSLLDFRRSLFLRPSIRLFLSDFGPTFAVIIMVAFSRLMNGNDVPQDTLESQLNPKFGFVTTSGRPWLINIFSLDLPFIFLAILPAIPLTMIFYLDQSVSQVLISRPKNMLRKGSAFHWDILIVGILNFFTSILGMPWCHGALPHSLLHPRALADIEEYTKYGRIHERVSFARETRWSNLLSHILMACMILMKPLLAIIPIAVLYGYFLYLGIISLTGNGMWDRLLLLVTQKEKYPPNHFVRRVPLLVIHFFTLFQLFCFFILWFCHSDFYITSLTIPPAMFFPVVVFCLIPVRMYLLPKIFQPFYVEIITLDELEEFDGYFESSHFH